MINKLLIGLLKLLSRLPFFFWYFVSDLLYYPAKWFYRRKVVVGNLKSVFPDMSEKEVNVLADKFYKNFCDLIVEIFKSLTISLEEIRARCIVKNPEMFDQNNCADREVLMYSIHNANWEWLGLGLSAGTEYPCSPIVQVQSSEFAHEYMKIIRSRFKGVAIPKSNAARFIMRNKDQKINIGIL
ncbi:MAG: hypothetical protein KI791_03670, partial [Cyclobacteriaceae bacterium]|nr:hypothetical protein [Cyclobacteriaceae bacterium SS2]